MQREEIIEESNTLARKDKTEKYSLLEKANMMLKDKRKKGEYFAMAYAKMLKKIIWRHQNHNLEYKEVRGEIERHDTRKNT